MDFLCIVCSKEVGSSMRFSVMCDGCDKWQHRTCNTGKFLYVFLNSVFLSGLVWSVCLSVYFSHYISVRQSICLSFVHS